MTATGANSIETNNDRQKFLQRLLDIEKRHRRWASFDSWMHQILIVLAAFAGFGSFAAGLLWPTEASVAGIIGAVPSLASILIGQLHCVKAANLHNCKAHRIENLRNELEFEGREIAVLSEELRAINEKFVAERENITAADELTESPDKSKSLTGKQV